MTERMSVRPAGRSFAGLIAVSAWFGLAVQFGATWGANGSAVAALWILLRYYTILTALAAALVFTALVLRPGTASPALLGGLTLNVLLVAIVYRLLLAGTLVQTGQEKLADLFLHSVTPALVLLFWLLRARRGALRYGDVGPWAAVPLLYFVYALTRGATDGIYPYPFLDVGTIGWTAVLRNAALIAAGFLAAGFGLVWIVQRRRLGTTPKP